jgi:adenosylcobinamide-GDP ribazoletransferase
MIKAFFIALGLLTRIPVPKMFYVKEGDSEKLFGWSVLFYPLVGLIIGGLLLLLSSIFSYLSLPDNGLVEAGLLLTLWVLLTGALHLDGLADSADAWLGGYGDPQRTLEIMKDPRSGPAAVVILLLVLLLKFSAIAVVAWEVLLLAPVLGRTAAMILLATTANVRQGGMAESAINNLSKTAVWLVVLLVIGLSIFLLKELSIGLLFLFVVGYLCRSIMIKRIKGITGDTIGALVEIIEAAALIVFVLLAGIQ